MAVAALVNHSLAFAMSFSAIERNQSQTIRPFPFSFLQLATLWMSFVLFSLPIFVNFCPFFHFLLRPHHTLFFISTMQLSFSSFHDIQFIQPIDHTSPCAAVSFHDSLDLSQHYLDRLHTEHLHCCDKWTSFLRYINRRRWWNPLLYTGVLFLLLDCRNVM